MKKILILSSFIFLCFKINAQVVYFNWAKQMGGTGDDGGSSIVLDAFGNSYTTGEFAGTVDFDAGTDVLNLSSKGGSDVFITKLDASGNLIWVKQIGGNLDDGGSYITIDNSGNLYLTGSFKDKVDFDPNSEVSNLTSKGGGDIFILKLTLSGNFIWVKQIGGVGSQESHDITIDKFGNIFTTGQFTKTTDFDPGLDSFNYTNLEFGNSLFVSKLDSSGKFLWAKKFDNFVWNQSISLTTDLSGNVLFTGDFGAEMDFNPGSGIFKLATLPDSFDIFICKLNSFGNFVWAKQMGGSAFSLGTSVITDKLGNVFTTGFFSGKADFDPSIGKTNYLNAKSTSYGAFISKLDSLGNFVWAKQLGGNFETTGSSLKIDGFGNIYSAGQFIGKEDFDPGMGVFNLQSTGYDACISKLDPNGNFIWAKNFGGLTQVEINDFVLDDFGNIYSTGYFDEECEFDPESGIFKLTSNGGLDIFIHKLGINPLNINSFEDKSSFVVYPNPNNGNATVSFEKAINNGSIKIINCLGQIVFSKNDISETNNEINISDQPKGIYFIELRDKNNISREKLIKN